MAISPSLHQREQDKFGGTSNDNTYIKTNITDSSGTSADVIPTNGQNGLVTMTPSHVSTVNSTSQTLIADESFTGEWEDISNFGVIVVAVTSNVSSATDGLMLEFSTDGTVAGIVSSDDYTIEAGAKKTFSFQTAAKFFRIVYTNGGTIQGNFNLQTVLKPYYVKPSSHRIQDSIVDDDDAELTKSVLTGESELTDNFENVSTFRKALNVNPAYVHRKIVNETFYQETVTSTTPSVAIDAEDTSITLTNAAGFTIGDEIILIENSLKEIGLITITNLVGNVITLDRPVANDYTTSAIITKVSSNMAVNGSLASPQIFKITAPTGNVWQITRMLLNIVDNIAADDGKFGGMAALTNGVSLRATTATGIKTIFANWKTNGDMKLDMYDVVYTDKAPAGNHGVNGRWTFTKLEIVAELDGDASPIQQLEVLIQDDLTDLVAFRIRAQGRIFSP